MEKSTSIKVIIRMFALSLTVSEILPFQMFDLENLGQGHRVHLLYCQSISNTDLCKSYSTHFYAIFRRFEDIEV